MKFANDIKQNKDFKRQQLQKEHIERVNEELLEIEKAQNTYEVDLENDNPYIDIPMIIKTQEAKDSLKEHGFYIDKVNQDIPYGITRVYLDESSFQIATNKSAYQKLTDSCLEKNDNSKDIKIKTDLNRDQEAFKRDYNCKWLNKNREANGQEKSMININLDEILRRIISGQAY